jgi:hypothetical protein
MPEDPFDQHYCTLELDEAQNHFLIDLLFDQLRWAYYYRKFKVPRPRGPRRFPTGKVDSYTIQDTDATYDSQIDELVGLLRDLDTSEDELAELAHEWLNDSN